MFNTMGWLGQFKSDLDVHGLPFAARQAKRKGVPISMVLEVLRLNPL